MADASFDNLSAVTFRISGPRIDLVGSDGAGNHWIRIAGQPEPDSCALGFNSTTKTVLLNWTTDFAGRFRVLGERSDFVGADGVGNHWFRIGGGAEPDSCALGFNVASKVVMANAGWTLQVENLVVDGDITMRNADLAEQFEVFGGVNAEAGTVMVLAEGGAVRACDLPYDTRVAGIVSGAGRFRPAIVLDKNGADGPRVTVALAGKVYCKVDATFAKIAIGDLLTSSPTPGHAMKATERDRAFGATIGKAMAEFAEGVGIIPVLVTLR